jgi:hypothetical protein
MSETAIRNLKAVVDNHAVLLLWLLSQKERP